MTMMYRREQAVLQLQWDYLEEGVFLQLNAPPEPASVVQTEINPATDILSRTEGFFSLFRINVTFLFWYPSNSSLSAFGFLLSSNVERKGFARRAGFSSLLGDTGQHSVFVLRLLSAARRSHAGTGQPRVGVTTIFSYTVIQKIFQTNVKIASVDKNR